ncbi:hypothetical protein SAMD00019534_055790 [Acytostelium subglobosum LB1]|uniref:hypothetical protein n=1 Tax=Acytostelium subglobosum LB1 TaxID=1410327 RepID=UPI00064504FA|nr:hypothetical protein SAMD00019534_055790 [Acytostelium subglobosum LB1]GAM22404.1 hypothetical protein SAMD00019534_055790 [Acytostelium subglobosum LB1]|eukprot:XP_012754524.1 hypothetical protein SAMD00019534_055790 [Acytostelium subglobosum LB1]
MRYQSILQYSKDISLNSDNTLESYGIVHDTELYLFNKKILENNSHAPDEVNLSIQDFQIPRLPTPKNLKELEASFNPLNKLFSLEYHLNNQVIATQYLKDQFENKTLQCVNTLSELNTQRKGISVALHSLSEYKSKLVHSYNSISALFKKQSPHFESLLLSFDSDLQRLKQVKLHDALKTTTKSTLLDCIPELEMRKWSDQCKREFEILKGKIMELGSQIDSIRDSVDMKRPLEINIKELTERTNQAREHTKHFQLLHQESLSYSDGIKRALEGSRSNLDQLSKVVSSFSEIQYSQDDNIRNSMRNVEILMTTLILFSKSKNSFNQYVFSELRSISRLQSEMRQLMSNFSVLNEAISKQTNNFFQLECIHHMPTAYLDALNETSRRRRFDNTINANVSRFIESLNIFTASENQKRQAFFEKVYRYLPPHIFNSLKEPLPSFQLHLPPFDTQLPSISDSQILRVDIDDDFTLIDGFDPNLQKTATSSSSSSSHVQVQRKPPEYERSFSASSLESKMNESQQLEKIRMLESRLQSTFLMASKTEEKYRDLQEKSRIMQSDSSVTNGLKLQLESLKKELEEKKQELEHLSSTIQQNSELIDSLNEREHEMSTKIIQLEIECATKKQQLVTCNEKIESLQREMLTKETLGLEESTSLQAQLVALEKDSIAQANHIDELQQQIELKQGILDSTTYEKENLLSRLNEKETKLFELGETNASLRNDLSTTKEKLSIYGERASLLDQDKTELEELKADLQWQLTQLSDKIKSLEDDIANKEAKASQDQETIESLRAETKLYQCEKENLSTNFEQLREEYNELQASFDESSARQSNKIEQLQSSIDQSKVYVEKMNADMKSIQESKHKEVKDLEEELSSLRLVNENDGHELTELLNQVEVLKDEIERQREHLEIKSRKLEQANSTIVAKESVITDLNKKINDIEATWKTKHSDTVGALTDNCDDLATQLERKTASMSKLEQELVATVEVINDQAHSISTLESKIKDLKQDIKEREALHNKDLANNDQLMDESDKLRNQVQELTKMLVDRDSSNDLLESDKLALIKQVSSLEKQVAQFEVVLSSERESHKQKIGKALNDMEQVLQEKAMRDVVMDSKEEAVHTLRQEVTSLEQTLKLQALAMAESNQQKQVLDKVHKESTQEFNETIAQLNEYIEELNQKNKRLQDQLDSVNFNSIGQHDKIEKLQSSMDERERVYQMETKEKDDHIDSLAKDKQTYLELIKKLHVVLDTKYDIGKPQAVLTHARHLKENCLSLEKTLEEFTKNERLLLEKMQSHEQSMVDMFLSKDNEEVAQLSNFQHSRTVVFKNIKNDVYEAVNINAPHYYLSYDSFDLYSDEISKKDIIIGSIVEINELTADSSHPYGLPAGTTYHELLVSKLR